jgi:acetate kinase
MNVLSLNAGSSSLKFGFFRVAAQHKECLIRGSASSLEEVTGQLEGAGAPRVEAIGHRIVHGGPRLHTPCHADGFSLRQLEEAAGFAPLHTPAALALILGSRARFPRARQVLCFDTGFHAGLPDVARVLPIPREFEREGIRRYGFHGLSCESILRQLGRDVPRRLIVAHLGAGASVTAILDRESVDTTMGLTPTGGVVMGTRSGDLDPGVLLHLMRSRKLDADAMEQLLDHRSGLLGVSGLASDIRELHHAESTSADARLAVRMFCTSVCKQVAAMITVLGGADLLVFTGGIGENDAAVRASIVHGLAWFGITLGEDSRCRVRVMASQEEEQIARHVFALLSDGQVAAR